jgi:GNAT superfamily N-acetyltransferase
MNMYFQYLREREPEINVVETKYGFALWKEQVLNCEKLAYIQDIYILPEYRKSNKASELAKEIEKQAYDKGISRLLGSVVPSAVNSTSSIQVLLNYGMKLLSAENDIIWFIKTIEKGN